MQFQESEIESWKNELKDYSKLARTAYKEPPQLKNIVINAKDKGKDFHPILQQYHKKEQDDNVVSTQQNIYKQQQVKKQQNQKKYNRNYDIVNLENTDRYICDPNNKDGLQATKNLIIPSIRQYNIISNDKVDPELLKNLKALKEEKIYEKKFDESKLREYNIVSNLYIKNHDEKFKSETQALENRWKEKFNKTRNYDPVKIKYYDENKEQQYQEQLVQKQKLHGQNAMDKLPPSMKFRESIIQDSSKPVPEEIIKIDQMKKNAKKRYELRYAIENEYHERDIENQNRNLERKLNRTHEQKFTLDKQKGFDIITLDKINPNDIEKFMFKKAKPTLWEQIKITSNDPEQQQIAKDMSQFSQTKTQEKSTYLAKTGQDFVGKKIQPPRQRVYDQISKKSSQKDNSMQKSYSTQSKQQSFKVDVQPSINDLNQLHTKKQYLDDPNNATLFTREPKINPQFVQPKRVIKTSGFVPDDSQYNKGY